MDGPSDCYSDWSKLDKEKKGHCSQRDKEQWDLLRNCRCIMPLSLHVSLVQTSVYLNSLLNTFLWTMWTSVSELIPCWELLQKSEVGKPMKEIMPLEKELRHLQLISLQKTRWGKLNLVDMDGPGECHTEWSSSEREKQTSYIKAYMWNLEKWYRWSYLQSRKRDTNIEDKSMDAKGEEVEWDELREWDWRI